MDTLTSITELLVGLACLGLAIATWRRPGRRRLLAGVLAVAGAAAVANAVWSLAG